MSDSAEGQHGAPAVSGQGAAWRGRRWLVLAAGLVALTAGSTFQYGLAYLIPVFRQEGLSLEQTGILVACPTGGLLLTLIAWGAAADRWGERTVLGTGLLLAGLVLAAGAAMHGTVPLGGCLVLAGAAGGSVYAASGRLILGWFARHERGLAMGIRQSSQPLGIAVAAVTLPTLAQHGRPAALLFLGAFCLGAASLVAAAVRDPPRPAAPPRPSRLASPVSPADPACPDPPALARPASPYRRSPYRRTPVLWRIHAASALLVVPQFTVATFALVFLVDTRGWQAPAAGRLLAIAQLLGAVSRLAAGYWSDRTSSRMRPMRLLAVTTAAVLLALAAAAAAGSAAAVPVLLIACVVAVSTNGLAFTAVAEHAGSSWAGRALGIHNTGQNALAVATPPLLAAAIGWAGFAGPFAVVALFPLAAAALVPVSAERAAADRATASARRQGS